MIKLISYTLLILTLLSSCDPGHHGNVSIDNQTNDTLLLKYQTMKVDTLIKIPPMKKIKVFTFGGLGEGRLYPGAPVEFSKISLEPTDTTKILNKSIENISNWDMINKNKRRYSSKEIKCWFTILPGDIKGKN